MSIAAFDEVLERLESDPSSVSEPLALAALWSNGEDAWLREDPRFRPTPWGRWISSQRYLINDLVVLELRDGKSELSLSEQLKTLAKVTGRPSAVCHGDPRLRFDDDRVRLAPSELTADPLLEQAPPLLQFVTHLPVLSLQAAAASEPAGDWGPSAEPQHVEPIGWLRVERLDRPLNSRMFVARVKGQSMDGGARAIEDGSWAVFEFAFHNGVAYDPGSATPVVLVRGAFDDPETGAYALKHWDRYATDIRLISANPDKDRYPDIVISADDADHLRVVATLTKPLRAADFARRPKPARTPGHRTLEGPEALAQVQQRLDRRLATFFDGAPAEPDDETPGQEPGWCARLVCLDAASGGPHLEIGPLEGLPPFVKKLCAVGTSWDGLILASNTRQRPSRISVPPGSGPWRWQAVGFETDTEDLGLTRLDLAELTTDAPTLFRVDAAGVGQPMLGRTVSPGHSYRVLIPPSRRAAMDGLGQLDSLAGGWCLWELPLATDVSSTEREALHRLGLMVGEPQPRLIWAIIPPTEWRFTQRGESYPVFSLRDMPVVHALAAGVAGDPRSAVFLRGPQGTERLALDEPTSTLIRLADLTPGRWACSLLAPRSEFAPTTLLFEVTAEPSPPPNAEWTAFLGEEDARISEHLERDLAAAEQGPLVVRAPSGWPVRVLWRDLTEVDLGTVHADADGEVDLANTTPRIAERARRRTIGDVVLDLGDLGCLTLRHQRSLAPEAARERLSALATSKMSFVQNSGGAWPLLIPHWFEPVVALLGYTLDAVQPEDQSADVTDLASWRLVVDERRSNGVTRSTSSVLILTTSLDQMLTGHGAALDAACAAENVTEAVVSDGLRWAVRRKGSKFRPPVLDVRFDVGREGLLAALEQVRR